MATVISQPPPPPPPCPYVGRPDAIPCAFPLSDPYYCIRLALARAGSLVFSGAENEVRDVTGVQIRSSREGGWLLRATSVCLRGTPWRGPWQGPAGQPKLPKLTSANPRD